MEFDGKSLAAAMQSWQLQAGPGMGMTFVRLRRTLGPRHRVALEATWAEAGLERDLREFKRAVQGCMPSSSHRETQAVADLETIAFICQRLVRQQDLSSAAQDLCDTFDRIAAEVAADTSIAAKQLISTVSARLQTEVLKMDVERTVVAAAGSGRPSSEHFLD